MSKRTKAMSNIQGHALIGSCRAMLDSTAVKKPMRLATAVAIPLVALMCVCGVARATPIVYNINITNGIETVSGTIATDGMIGTLVASDITAWSVSAIGPVAFSIMSSQPGSLVFCGIDCGLSATANALRFDPPFFLSSFHLGVFTPALVETLFFAPGDVGERIVSGVIEFHEDIAIPTPATIATTGASVPEPGTFTLLGLAFAGLGFARKRFRRRQSTAV